MISKKINSSKFSMHRLEINKLQNKFLRWLCICANKHCIWYNNDMHHLMSSMFMDFENNETLNLNNKIDFKKSTKNFFLSKLGMYWKYKTLKKFQGQSILNYVMFLSLLLISVFICKLLQNILHYLIQTIF